MSQRGTATASDGAPGSVTVIGAGNVATHLCRALHRSGLLRAVVSTDGRSARLLADELPGVTALACGDPLPPSDVRLLCVTDAAIATVVASMPDDGALWLHTAGGVGLDTLQARRRRCGILYPLQTFSRCADVNLRQTPMLVEAALPADLAVVKALASRLSDSVIEADSRQRHAVHVAAVIACNFTTHLCAVAQSVLADASLPATLLTPLLQGTFAKLLTIDAAAALTGPARRGDLEVTASHQTYLDARAPRLPHGTAEIYRLITESIRHSNQ